MFVMETIDDLWEHIAYVLAYAPHSFPHEDFLADDQQMTIDLAFLQLRQGIQLAYPENEHSAVRDRLSLLLDQSYAAYERGDEISAGHLLNQFQDGIFKQT